MPKFLSDIHASGTSTDLIVDGNITGTGNLTLTHGSTPYIHIVDSTNDVDLRLKAANSYGYIELDNDDNAASSRLIVKVDGNQIHEYLSNGQIAHVDGTYTIRRDHASNQVTLDLSTRKDHTGSGNFTAGDDVARINFRARDSVTTNDLAVGSIITEADNTFTATDKKTRMKIQVYTGSSLSNVLFLDSDKSATFYGSVTGLNYYGTAFYDSSDTNYYLDPAGTSYFNSVSLASQLLLPSYTSSPANPTISFDSNVGGIWYDSNDDQLWFRAGNNNKAYVSSAGVISQANVYTASSSTFRNYSGVWGGSTGLANNGFYFLNTANSNTTRAMDLSHDGNVVFNGYVRGTIFADKDATAFYVNPGAGANSNAAVLRGQIKIGTHANANTIYSDGGKTQIATHNSKSKYAANGQYNGITVLANDARKDNTAMATTALVLANTASNSSTKSLLRLNRTDGRYNQDSWSSGQGSFNTRFDIRGDGKVYAYGNIYTGSSSYFGAAYYAQSNTNYFIDPDSISKLSGLTVEGVSSGNGQVDVKRTSGAHIRLQAQSTLTRIGAASNHALQIITNDTGRWNFQTDGHFRPVADSTYDIGTNAIRVRNVYADTLYGDGSNLTNLPSGSTTTINNNANNRVITGSGTADTLEAESGLTFDGDILEIVGSGTTTKRLKVSPSTDYGRAHIGRAALGKLGFDDHAGFAHEDQNSQTNYALLQSDTGNTYVNAASGKAGYLRVNNSTIGYWNANGLYVSIYYDKDNTDFYANPAGRSEFGSLTVNSGAVWDATTQGTTKGALHLDPNNSTDHAGGAITFGASDSSSGTTAQAGIYIRSDGSYGTRMYFSTTDSYASGSKTAMYILQNGQVNITRSNLIVNSDVRTPIFYDSDNTSYWVNPAGSHAANLAGRVDITTASDVKMRFKTPSTDSSDWNYIEFYKRDGNRSSYFGINGSGNPIWAVDDGGPYIKLEDSGSLITAGGDLTVTGDLTVSGGDITLGGTGRIQGIDTVSAGTDAANKNYVDNNFQSADTTYEFNMSTQLSANTWTDTGIDGTDMVTGTYIMQVEVDDHNIGGGHYDEYYSATISWFSGSTNSTMHDEIVVHRAGHAPNNSDLQFRTLRASATDSHDLMLQVKINTAYNAAPDQSNGKTFKFKFRKLI